MEDDIKKITTAINLRCPEVVPRQYKNERKTGRLYLKPMSTKQLNALRAGAVPEGKVLNPYGKLGDTFRARYRLGKRVSWREESMQRRRIKMKVKKAIALEAHELQQLARENATAAMRTLIEISKNPRAPEATRIAASQVILDRGYGKASQTSITASVTGGKAAEIDSTELDKRIGQALKRVEEITNRTSKAGASKKRPSDLHKYN